MAAFDLGCAGVGRKDGPRKSGQERGGGGGGCLKCPKIMRDMICSLGKQHYRKSHDLVVLGFIMMGRRFERLLVFRHSQLIVGLKLKTLVMDRPSLYICRLKSTEPFYFPTKASDFGAKFGKLLATVRSVKEHINNMLQIIDAPETVAGEQLAEPGKKELLPCPTTPVHLCKRRRIIVDDN
ncbi:hypothetical protein BCR43DRAFT_114651 [Syncephalastrum racemosum]|uniref:Uncharacterized protein n=1 Tax=Syncephalastrum racemosum TaxID=13706 RepID=A0A1X2H0B9_SYNRA|nr:hypothetical protein BCR43DRAFT_114651 [Syncephalastrum racemosum]